MTESALLAGCGALSGFGVAYALMAAGAALMPDLRMVLPQQTAGLTRVGLGTIGLDAVTLLFAIALTTATAVLFGLGPAWRASRRDLSATMRVGSSGSVSQRTSGFAVRNLLIVGEIAIALLLLVASGLMLKSVARLQATELGFRPASLLTFRLAMPFPQYDSTRATQLFIQMLERLGARGEIESIAYGSCAPLTGGCNATTASFPGQPTPPGSRLGVGVRWASPNYFETLGIRVIRGRVFTDEDRSGQPKVVVINEAAARAFWGDEDPIGKRIALGQGNFHDGAEVVGIVADVRFGAVESAIQPDVYLPLLQSSRSQGLIFIRSRTAPEHLVSAVRTAIQSLDPDLPLSDVKTMEERFGDATWRTSTSAWLLGVFATLAMTLAAIGIYGVMSQGVAQRSREIGVRMALGATARDVFRLILGRALVIAVAGVAIGVALAIPSMKLLAALLYQVTPGDPTVLVALAAMLLAVAVLASYLPARRATRVDPLTTLRAE
jgi:predicted permease